MELPAPVLHSLFALNAAGYEAFVVGGCVRDALMGTKPYDWDITTSALPEQTLTVFQNYRTIETGLQHGTVTVLIEDMPLEITTYRVDGNYSDGRHPDHVTFTRSLRADLRRRDFTVNAMAYHPQIGLVDPFHGQRDLKKGIIRCVGNPKKRFTEDALRILRGLRFSSTLDFIIKPTTSKAMRRLAHTIPCVSIERISVEFNKLLCGKKVQEVLADYADLFEVILPEIDFKKSAKFTVFDDPLRNLAALLFDKTPEEAENACRRLKLNNRTIEGVVALVQCRALPLTPTRRDILHALHRLGPELTSALIDLRSVTDDLKGNAIRAKWQELQRNNDLCYQLKALQITGQDLISAGIPIGPELGSTLNSLLNAVMDGACPNEKEALQKKVTKKPVQ